MTVRHRLKNEGFSLLELVIAFFIFAIIGSAVLLALRSGSQETKFINEQFSASLLARKVIEDIFCEVDINPLSVQEIDVNQCKMVDGESHFFSNLEDSRPPSFVIQPDEGVISSEQQPLYSLVEAFKISIEPDLSDSKIYSSRVILDWDSKVAKGKHVVEFHFHNLNQKKDIDFPFEFAPGDLEKYICGYLYATQTQSVDAILALPQFGGRKETIEALGQIGLMSSWFFGSTLYTKTLKEIEQLEIEKATLLAACPIQSSALLKCLDKLVKRRYELVKMSFQVFAFICPYFDQLIGNCDEANLGVHYREPLLVKLLLENVTRLGKFFTMSLWQNIVDLQLYFSPQISPWVSLKKLSNVSVKLVNLGRIIAYNDIYQQFGRDGKADYIRLLEQIRAVFSGRFPALERLIAQEVGIQQNSSASFSQSPAIQNVVDFIKPGGKFAIILKFIKDNYSL